MVYFTRDNHPITYADTTLSGATISFTQLIEKNSFEYGCVAVNEVGTVTDTTKIIFQQSYDAVSDPLEMIDSKYTG